MAFFIGLVPVIPPLVIAYVTDHTMGLAASALCLLFLGFGVSIREQTPWVRMVAVPYWILVMVIQIPFAILGMQTAPVHFLVALVLAFAVFLPIPWRRLSDWILTSSVAILGTAAAGELWDRSHLVSLVTAALTIVAVALILFLARRGTFRAVNRIALSLCVFVGLVNAKGYLVYMIHKPMAIKRVLEQPGITAIYDYRKAPFSTEVPPETMFIARVPGKELFVVGPHDPYHEVLLIQPGESPHVPRIPIDGRGGDQALFHGDEPGVFIMAGRSHLYRIGVDPPRILNAVDLGDKKLPLSMLRYDPKNERYIVIRGYHPDVCVVDRSRFLIVKRLQAPHGSCYTDALVDVKSNSLILLGDYLIGGQLVVYDLNTLNLRKVIHFPWDPLTLCTLDDQGRRLFVATLLRDRILVFSLDTLEMDEVLDSEYGLRNLNFDPNRRLLIAGNLFNGHLSIYDVDGRSLIGKLFLGKLVRWVEVDPENHKWYANSSAGGFEIDPDLALSRLHCKESAP